MDIYSQGYTHPSFTTPVSMQFLLRIMLPFVKVVMVECLKLQVFMQIDTSDKF